MQYRADIDGLRAIAVVAVLLYHAQVPLFAGGYIGVDVFFVISGYLITSLILGDQRAGTFTLKRFYQRRLWRIGPVLIAMVLASLAVGWIVLAPRDYQQLLRSASAAVLSFSNVLFWRDAGYFDTLLEEKPLLHTWSLGVEEQFYLVFPLYLMLIARLSMRKRWRITGFIAALSFGAGLVAIDGAPTAVFYLAHFRIWELLIGAILAMGAIASPRADTTRTLAVAVGLAAIGYAAIAFSEQTKFPGFAALIPTVGTALILWAGVGGQSIATRALSTRPMRFVGKISYSLYIWHYPVFAFAGYAMLGDPTATRSAMLLGLTSALALVSWRFVEQPARAFGSGLSWARTGALASAAAAALCAFCFTGYLLQGFPGRLDATGAESAVVRTQRNPDRDRCFVSDPSRFDPGQLCRIGGQTDDAPDPSFVVWGDSHGEALRAGFAAAADRQGRAGLFAGERSCPPLIGVDYGSNPQCAAISTAILRDILARPSIETVVISARWAWWAEGTRYGREDGAFVSLSAGGAFDRTDNHAALAAGLDETLAALVRGGKHVYLIGPIPEVGYDVPRYFHLRSLGLAKDQSIVPTRAAFDQRQAFVRPLLTALGERYGVPVVWPHESLCGSGSCRIESGGELLYYDDDHPSVAGALALSPTLETVLVRDVAQ